jgi:hypothetical protein
MNDSRRFAAATDRNRQPILDVLRRFVGPGSRVLEIASGSGQHAIFLAPELGVAVWQPTDPDPSARASIDAWRLQANVANVLPAIDLDVTAKPWPEVLQDPANAPNAIICANMIHISPWETCLAMLEGAGSLLGPQGVLYLYGPYKRDGRHTAPSNEAFDESLRARNPAWGVRDLGDVTRAANAAGLELVEVVPMPANNLSVVFRR